MDDKESLKIQYLQMIQEPIGRMSTLSAIFKGFVATVATGIISLNEIVTKEYFVVSGMAVFLFAFLDMYYLYNEKKFRNLYEQVRSGKHEIDFSMDTTSVDKKKLVCECFGSTSIWLFYSGIIILLFIVYFSLNQVDCAQ